MRERGGGGGRRRQLGRPGVDLPLRHRRKLPAADPRRRPRRLDVELPGRADRAIENIEVLRHTEVREIHGDDGARAVVVEETRAGERRDLDGGGLFIFIGAEPCTEWLDGRWRRTSDGFLLTGGDLDVTHLDVDPIDGGRPSIPGDEPARRLRGRRRPHRIDQARSLGGRRGLDVGAARPPAARERDRIGPTCGR